MNIDKMKEKYNVLTLEEAIKLKENELSNIDKTNETTEVIEVEGTI